MFLFLISFIYSIIISIYGPTWYYHVFLFLDYIHVYALYVLRKLILSIRFYDCMNKMATIFKTTSTKIFLGENFPFILTQLRLFLTAQQIMDASLFQAIDWPLSVGKLFRKPMEILKNDAVWH